MAKNSNEREQSQPAPTKRASDFRKALLWTAIPVVALDLIGAGVMWGQRMNSVLGGWFVTAGLGVWILAILACIGFAIARKRQIALGILAGVGIGLAGQMLSCFTLAATQWSGA